MDKKNTLLLTVIAVATLLVAIVGATFAYFTAQVGEGANVDIRVETSTADTTMFNLPKDIVIEANQINFNEEEGTATHSLMGTSYASVNYTANNNTKKGDYCYKVGLVVESNSFVYSLPKTDGEQKNGYYPELLLRVWKGSGTGDLVDVNTEGFKGDGIVFKEYGKADGINVNSLYTTDGDSVTADSTKDDTTFNVPYKTLPEGFTTKKICKVDANSNDTSTEENCSDETNIGGYDITMLGFSDTENQALYKAAFEKDSNLRTPEEEAQSKLYFDTTGIDIVTNNKKVVLIPVDATAEEPNYEHQITISASEGAGGTLTKNDYWRFDVIFVNYSDADVKPVADEGNTGLGDQYKNVGKALRAKIRFQPLAECSQPKADAEP